MYSEAPPGSILVIELYRQELELVILEKILGPWIQTQFVWGCWAVEMVQYVRCLLVPRTDIKDRGQDKRIPESWQTS